MTTRASSRASESSSGWPGYKTAGNVFLERSFKDMWDNFYFPKDGTYLARLDDPYAINSNGARTAQADQKAIFTNKISYIHNNKEETRGADGAYLELDEDVTIPLGKSLLFHYAFIACDGLPRNDFAVLEAYPTGATNPVRKLICDIRSLRAPNNATFRPRGLSTDWLVFSWHPTHNGKPDGQQISFTGKI
jgi:hypothetical protein